jgi:hypothetical protein
MFYGKNENGVSIRKLKYTGSNGQGDCFVKKGENCIPSLNLCVGFKDSPSLCDLQTLIILSERLGVPLSYDFDSGETSIEIVSAKKLRAASKII